MVLFVSFKRNNNGTSYVGRPPYPIINLIINCFKSLFSVSFFSFPPCKTVVSVDCSFLVLVWELLSSQGLKMSSLEKEKLLSQQAFQQPQTPLPEKDYNKINIVKYINAPEPEPQPLEEEEAHGTVFSSTFNLTNESIGSGILSLPFAMSQCGIVLGPMMMLVVSSLMGYTSVIISQTARLCPKAKSYEKLVGAALGPRASLVMAACIVFQTFGSCTSYMVIIGDSFTPILENYFPHVTYSHYIANRIFATLFISVVFIFPLALQKKINSLRFSSTLSICCLSFIVFSVILRSAQQISHIPDHHVVYFGNGNLIQAIPLIIFAFRCHTALPPIYKEMKDNQKPGKIKSVIFFSLLTCSILYYSNAIFGYLTFFEKTKGNILTNYPSNDILVNIARFLLTAVMVCHYPMVAYCCRSALDHFIFGHKPMTTMRHVCETLALWSCFFTVSILVPKVTVILGLAGSFPFTEFFFPSMFLYFKSKHPDWVGLKGKTAVLVSIFYFSFALVVAVVCSTAIILKNFVKH